MKQPLTASTISLKAKLENYDSSSMRGNVEFWDFSFLLFRLEILNVKQKKKTPRTNYKILPVKEIEDKAIEQRDVSLAAVGLD